MSGGPLSGERRKTLSLECTAASKGCWFPPRQETRSSRRRGACDKGSGIMNAKCRLESGRWRSPRANPIICCPSNPSAIRRLPHGKKHCATSAPARSSSESAGPYAWRSLRSRSGRLPGHVFRPVRSAGGGTRGFGHDCGDEAQPPSERYVGQSAARPAQVLHV